MNWGVFFTFVILIVVETAQGGLCVPTATGPGLPAVQCTFPNCPNGNDCLPPEIDRKTATASYSEPLLKWMDVCPSKEFPSASCWEAYLEFNLKAAAQDPSGVAMIGANVAIEVGNKRVFRKYWQQAGAKSADGRYELDHTMTLHVPAGQTLNVQVVEICAKDTKQNEICVLPAKREEMPRRGE